MKEEINLLPPGAQQFRWQQLYAVKARSLYHAGLVALGVVALGYIGTGAALYVSLQDTIAALQPEEEGASELAEKTKDINAKIQVVHNRLKQQPFSPYIAQALAVVPAGITITKIEINRADDTITLSGRSENRSAIVQLENSLRELTWAGTVAAPLQNFASGPNVTFEFTIKRKL